MHRREFLTASCASLAAPLSLAQEWPLRPIRMVVPFPPGGAADTVTRELARRLQASLGKPCVVDNRPGASGTIGVDAVIKAPADGHTLLSHVSSIVIQPHLGTARHDVLSELMPVSQTVTGSYVLVTHPSFPAHDLKSFIDAVRRSPGRYNYGSFGSGSGPHLAMELLKGHAGLFILHVPFRGAGPALQELLAGRLEMAFETTLAALPHIHAGKLKPLRSVACVPRRRCRACRPLRPRSQDSTPMAGRVCSRRRGRRIRSWRLWPPSLQRCCTNPISCGRFRIWDFGQSGTRRPISPPSSGGTMPNGAV